jgi:hypothetical protein
LKINYSTTRSALSPQDDVASRESIEGCGQMHVIDDKSSLTMMDERRRGDRRHGERRSGERRRQTRRTEEREQAEEQAQEATKRELLEFLQELQQKNPPSSPTRPPSDITLARGASLCLNDLRACRRTCGECSILRAMNHTSANPSSANAATARLSVSTWSLNTVLGSPPFFGVGAEPEYSQASANGALSLIELPARLKEFGIGTLEICHFHLPSREASYLQELRGAIEEADVELWSILIDDGDINHPQHAERDVAWMRTWLEVAGQLGSRNARVIAGKAEPSAESLAQSRDNLRQLAAHAQSNGVQLMTENWYATLSRPEYVLQTLDALEGKLGSASILETGAALQNTTISTPSCRTRARATPKRASKTER